MRTTRQWCLLLITVVMAFTSCKDKDSDPAPSLENQLLGTWQFMTQTWEYSDLNTGRKVYDEVETYDRSTFIFHNGSVTMQHVVAGQVQRETTTTYTLDVRLSPGAYLSIGTGHDATKYFLHTINSEFMIWHNVGELKSYNDGSGEKTGNLTYYAYLKRM